MKTKEHKSKALRSVCSILILAGSLLAVDAWAQTAETEGSTEADANAQQEAPDASALQQAPDLGVTGNQGASKEERQQWRAAREARKRERVEQVRLAKENATQNGAIPAAVSSRPSLSGLADVGGQQAGSNRKPSPALVSSPASVTGIEVSFKLDPRLMKSLYSYMGEGWLSPPISIDAAVPDGAIPTVEARADVLDAKGQPVDSRPEWIPADPEMVAVSPGHGNEVLITVRHAGQSIVQVTSAKLSKRLSVKAWYQGDSIQAEISE